MRHKHTGANGEVKLVPHRNVFVGFWNGKVVVTKKTEAACHAFLANYQSTSTVVVKPISKQVVKHKVQPKRNVSPDIKASAAAFMAYREKLAMQEFASTVEAEIPDLLDDQEDRWDRCEKFDREYFNISTEDY